MQFEKLVMNKVGRHSKIIEQPGGSLINFLSFRYGAYKAFYIKAHGRVTKTTVRQLEKYQAKEKIEVCIVSEQGGHIPRFETLNRYLRWRKQVREKYDTSK